VVGYQELWNRHEHCILSGDGYVRPGYEGLGIGTTMLRLAEAEARRQHIPAAPPDRRVILRNGVDGDDPAAELLHQNEGYHPSRYFWTMEIQLEQQPEPVQDWPAGIRLADFRFGLDDFQVFTTIDEAFRDHWGYTPMSYELWRLRRFERQDFDPGLWFLAWDGNEIAGAALCEPREGIGWVNQLAVRRPWRRRGLGLALLRTAFAVFFQRSYTTVRLGVDAENPTGAIQLYEKAGMSVHHQFVIFDKVLRDGRE
jgi:mycothiol synthase